MLPEKGAEVCSELNKMDRFHYTFRYVIESPKQENPPDDSARGDYGIPPSNSDLHFELQHDGTFMQPDRADYELSTPGQPAIRTIRIGQSEWHLLLDQWVPPSQPSDFPFFPPLICDSVVSPLDLSGQTGVPETVGDIQTRHLHLVAAPIPASAQVFGSGSDMGRLLTNYDVDLWLNEKNAHLVKVQAVSKANYPYGRELSSTIVLEIGSSKGIDEIKPPI